MLVGQDKNVVLMRVQIQTMIQIIVGDAEIRRVLAEYVLEGLVRRHYAELDLPVVGQRQIAVAGHV